MEGTMENELRHRCKRRKREEIKEAREKKWLGKGKKNKIHQ